MKIDITDVSDGTALIPLHSKHPQWSARPHNLEDTVNNQASKTSLASFIHLILISFSFE
jgi:hypothetical protein